MPPFDYFGGRTTSTHSYNRQHAALCDLPKGVKRTSGVDIVQLVCRCPPTIAHDATGKLYDDVKDLPDVRTAFATALVPFTLNKKQELAALASFSSTLGVVHISGVTGTGKTHALLATLAGHIKAGQVKGAPRRKVLSIARTTAGVIQSAKTLLELNVPKDQSIEICLFAGSLSTPKEKHNESELQKCMRRETAELEGFLEWAWGDLQEFEKEKCTHPELYDYYYYTRVKAYRKEVFENSSHPLHQTEEDLRAAEMQLPDAQRKQDKLKIQREIRQATIRIAESYLEDKADWVLCANDRVTDLTLMEFYKPTVLALDDAHFANTGEGVVPLTAYMESTMLLMLTGDHTYQIPPALSRGYNEFSDLLEHGTFEYLKNDGALVEGVDKFELEV